MAEQNQMDPDGQLVGGIPNHGDPLPVADGDVAPPLPTVAPPARTPFPRDRLFDTIA